MLDIANLLNHPFNKGRPVFALSKWVEWQVRSRLAGEVTMPWVGDAKIIGRRGMSGLTGNVYFGLHEPADMAFVLHLLRAEDVFYDIGANAGSYTILASKVCGARTYAFEPDPGTVQGLQRNIDGNGVGDLVTVFQTALGDRTGTVQFTVGMDAMNHIAEAGDTSVQTVPLTRLDDVDLPPATLMKIDVEGHEEAALAGAERALSQPSLLGVISESEEPCVRDVMARHGFQRAYYNPIARTLSKDRPWDSYKNALYVRDFDHDRLTSAPRRRVHGITI